MRSVDVDIDTCNTVDYSVQSLLFSCLLPKYILDIDTCIHCHSHTHYLGCDKYKVSILIHFSARMKSLPLNMFYKLTLAHDIHLGSFLYMKTINNNLATFQESSGIIFP